MAFSDCTHPFWSPFAGVQATCNGCGAIGVLIPIWPDKITVHVAFQGSPPAPASAEKSSDKPDPDPLRCTAEDPPKPIPPEALEAIEESSQKKRRLK